MPNGRPKKDEDLRPWIDNMKKWMRATQDDGESEMSPDPGRREEDAYLASEYGAWPLSAVTVLIPFQGRAK